VILVSNVNFFTSTERGGGIIIGNLIMRTAIYLPFLGIFFVAELPPCAVYSGDGAGL
jgi:hypothetical protein